MNYVFPDITLVSVICSMKPLRWLTRSIVIRYLVFRFWLCPDDFSTPPNPITMVREIFYPGFNSLQIPSQVLIHWSIHSKLLSSSGPKHGIGLRRSHATPSLPIKTRYPPRWMSRPGKILHPTNCSVYTCYSFMCCVSQLETRYVTVLEKRCGKRVSPSLPIGAPYNQTLSPAREYSTEALHGVDAPSKDSLSGIIQDVDEWTGP